MNMNQTEAKTLSDNPVWNAFINGQSIQAAFSGPIPWKDVTAIDPSDFLKSPHCYRIKPVPPFAAGDVLRSKTGAIFYVKAADENAMRGNCGQCEDCLITSDNFGEWKVVPPIPYKVGDLMIHVDCTLLRVDSVDPVIGIDGTVLNLDNPKTWHIDPPALHKWQPCVSPFIPGDKLVAEDGSRVCVENVDKDSTLVCRYIAPKSGLCTIGNKSYKYWKKTPDIEIGDKVEPTCGGHRFVVEAIEFTGIRIRPGVGELSKVITHEEFVHWTKVPPCPFSVGDLLTNLHTGLTITVTEISINDTVCGKTLEPGMPDVRDVYIKPEDYDRWGRAVMVPLSPEDIHPGSALRHKNRSDYAWSIIRKMNSSGVWAGDNTSPYTWEHLQKNMLISRPGAAHWEPCEKPERINK